MTEARRVEGAKLFSGRRVLGVESLGCGESWVWSALGVECLECGVSLVGSALGVEVF